MTDSGSTLREIIEIIIIAVLIALFVRSFLFETFVVDGPSMLDSLYHSERVLVNKFIYHLRAPQRGEVIVFQCPTDARRDFVKRVTATAGEVVEISGGQVYINGKPLQEDYLTRPGDSDFSPVKVPPRSVFVLGDNRTNSDDSRHFGFVPVDSIRGKVMLIFWPPLHIRRIEEGAGAVPYEMAW